jgi:hypothetical protein
MDEFAGDNPCEGIEVSFFLWHTATTTANIAII